MKPLAMTPRRWLLTVHLVLASIMLGGAVLFLVLSITAAGTDDPVLLHACYTVMLALSRTSVRASTIGTVVTGVLLSVFTHWGLLKYYWIIAKEVLTLAAAALGVAGMYIWSGRAAAVTAAEGMGAWSYPAFTANHTVLMAGIVLQLVSLIALFALSVFKPWGPRRSRKSGGRV
ncbi:MULTISPECIES: hypothetical protein [Paenibacillus]|uniref:hypothetical protein n=1 Tax=Paenibacillus TaxID=44249 RepID=UPI0022B8B984|nr:hypothetical protein [Paenibacillus caseinilyticus]MCZ8523254.1 hypothetical protein [Paenibacillus caseinilyticus]